PLRRTADVAALTASALSTADVDEAAEGRDALAALGVERGVDVALVVARQVARARSQQRDHQRQGREQRDPQPLTPPHPSPPTPSPPPASLYNRTMLNLHFIGAAREVTGSMHLLETPAGKLLIDCGFYQGKREESRKRNRALHRDAVAADAVILTHAHIDHSGS